MAFTISYAQTENQKQQITKNYDLEKLSELSNTFSQIHQDEKNEALRLAVINNWKVRYTEDGVLYELQRVSATGKPIYYRTTNLNAAKSTRANHLHSGGLLGLDVEGQNMTAFVWDGGIARATHQEYDGAGGTDRFSAGGDSGTLNDHSAHVMGTIIAAGVVSLAKGMAPQAYGIGYDWNDDEAEATTEAANGMMISNHSYGYNMNDLDDWVFGAYINESYRWDAIHYNAPYYLQVTSCGNDGNNNTSNGDPLDGNQFFDKLSAMSICKNNLSVANSIDANVASDGTLVSVSIDSGSSEGPTDDLRIKPDIAGNGYLLYSTLHNSNTSYGSYTGTSMAAPNVAGSLLLLQQHYNDVNDTFMRSSTLKGLALHAADDAGPSGPDATWGWGLLNTKASAEAISNNGLGSIVFEGSLNDGESYTITVESDNTNPLQASICWTDPVATGTINNGTANDPTPVLVNDLDIIVSNGTDYEPWKLTSVTTNNKGNNNVDTFERVDVNGASGTYTITVTHKGTLTDGKQDFAFVVTGLNSEFTFHPVDDVVEQCAPGNAEFDFEFVTATGSTASTTFSAQNVPSGASASFSPTSISSDGTVTMTISGLASVTPGEYLIDVTAENANETETKQVTLIVYNPSIDIPSLLSPSNNASNLPYSFNLTWTDDFNAQTYDVQIAEDVNFTNIFDSATVEEASYNVFNLDSNTTYFWRVKPVNMCASGSYSSVREFTTTDACVSYPYSGGAMTIPDAGSLLTTNFTVTENFTVQDVNVYLDISHGDVGALVISLVSPGGTTVYLSSPDANCDAQNILASFDNAGQPISCNEGVPIGYYGILHPSGTLSAYDGENSAGVWTLNILDLEPGIIGTLDSWTLEVCDENVVSVEDLEFDDLSIWPNPTNGEVTISLESNSKDIAIALYDISGRLISEKTYTNTSTNFKESIDFGQVTDGIYIVTITNGEKFSSNKLIIDKN